MVWDLNVKGTVPMTMKLNFPPVTVLCKTLIMSRFFFFLCPLFSCVSYAVIYRPL